MVYLTLAAGLALLLFCGDLLVRGAVALAEKLNIPPLVIGLTIVAFGTSAPELVVSLRAALAGSPGIALGNVVGSNIANVLLVLGLPALICATSCDQPAITRNTVFVLLASILFVALCFVGPLAFWHGAILFSLMVAFLIESGRRAIQKPAQAVEECSRADNVELIDGVEGVPDNQSFIILFLIAGLIGLPVGAHLTVDSASQIALGLGVSEAVVGLSLVAIGTSLPELAATFAAAYRGNCALALGNVLGSNLFNILAIMGITAMVAPVPIPDGFFRLDLWVMLGTVVVLIPFVLMRTRITRIPALSFVAAYAGYIYLVFAPRVADVASVTQ